MQRSMLDQIRIHVIRNRNRRFWRKFVQILGCIVVFCTTYALILPAITMEQTAYCGLEEHTHSESCCQATQKRELICSPQTLQLHVHSGSCYDAEGKLVCGQTDYVVHNHDANCYAEGQLICTLPERSAHVHTDACYAPAETEPTVLHTHGDGCYTMVKGELICGLEEYEGHTHSDACYTPGTTLNCTLTENHVHAEGCYTYPLVCTLSTEPHVHGEGCYSTGGLTCAIEENHVHGEGCSVSTLICENAEEGHEHSDECYVTEITCTIPEGHVHGSSCYESVLTCGKEAGECHVHGEGCYSTEPALVCTLTENHIHNESCYEPELTCGIPEDPGHSHSDECYQWNRTLSCGLEEGQPEPTEPAEPVLVCTEPGAAVHVHGDSCFVTVEGEPAPLCGNTDESHIHEDACYACGLPAHEHTLACYSDPEADVETPAVWEATFAHVALTGDRPADLVAIAESQLGYTESTRNYTVWEDNSIHGYTRYGDWYHVPHGDWCGMFVSFCLRYAGIGNIPINYGVRPWIEDLTELGLYHVAEEYAPKPGDIVFFDWEGDELSDHVGIVVEVQTDTTPARVKTIEGNSSNCVQYCYYDIDDSVLLGYGVIPAEEEPEEEEKAEEEPVYYCGKEEHTHGTDCYDAAGSLTCELEEHTHTEECTTEPVAVTYYCGKEEHIHGGDCHDAAGSLTCELEEHTHNEECTAEPVAVTYYCGKDEHTHGEDCYDAEGNLICEVEEHTHSEECSIEPVTYYCGLDEHVHGDNCYNELGNLICTILEHTHNATCLIQDRILEEGTKTAVIYLDGSYETLSEDTTVITVTGTMPADAEVRAYPVQVENHLQILCAYDIEIIEPDGRIFEPAEGETLNVVIQSSVLEDQQDMQVYYIPDEGEPEQMDTATTEDGVTFEAPHFTTYAVALADTGRLEPFEQKGLTFDYNTVRDAFTHDSAYAQFYNANSPLGTAGSFHIVAFDTATLKVHTNGNVLAKNLIANSNFGTNSKNGVNLIEISYAQNYQKVDAGSGADSEDYFVVGSGNIVSLVDNGNAFAIDGTKLNTPKNLIQDEDTDTAPFIDLNRVEQEIKSIAANLNSYETSDQTIMEAVLTGADPYLELQDPNNVGVYNLTAAELAQITSNGRGWDMRGFETGGSGTIVINIDCADWDRSSTLNMPAALVYVDGEPVGLTETLDFSAGKVIWNFVNAEGVTIGSNLMTGMIVAPESHIDLLLSFNGTAIGDSVTNHSETHRTDFAGRVVPTEQIDSAHIHVYKVDKANYGQFLQGAEFALYEWSGSAWVIAQQNSENQIDITDAGGKVIFQNLKYNVAYKLVETRPPAGYRISTDCLYFFFDHENTTAYPITKPDDFTASSEDDCIIHYYPNESSDIPMTSLSVEKKWQDQNGKELPFNPWDSITLDVLVQKATVKRNENGELVYENDKLVYDDFGKPVTYSTVTVTAADGWIKTINDLPLFNEDQTEKYQYSVQEQANEAYKSEMTVSEDGKITLTNTVEVTAVYDALAISKDWLLLEASEGGGSAPPADIQNATFQLWRVSKTDLTEDWSNPVLIEDNITLNPDNNWIWQAEENSLLMQQTVGGTTVYYAYYVVETPIPEGYYPDYYGIDADDPLVIPSTGEPGTGGTAVKQKIGVTNHEIEYRDLTITKSWVDKYGKPLVEEFIPDSITVQIQQSADGGNTWVPYGEPVSITKAMNWTYAAENLPMQGLRGERFTYRIQEDTMDGFLSSGGELEEITAESGEKSYEAALTNKQVETTSLQIKKVWKDLDGSELKQPPVDSIQIQIQQSSDGGTTWNLYGDPKEVKASEDWSLTVTGLPAGNPYNSEITYTYRVQEVTVSELYESTVSVGEDGVVTITNSRKTAATDIEVVKRWRREGNVYQANSGSVQVKLYQILEESSGDSGEGMVNLSVNIGNNHKGDGSMLNQTLQVPAGTVVTIVYRDTGTGYRLTYDSLWDDSKIIQPVEETTAGSLCVVTYHYTVNQDTSLFGFTTSYQNQQPTVSMTTAGGASSALLDTVTLSAGSWSHTFSDLPLHTYDEAGNITGNYSYYVEETDGSKYSVTYTDAEGNTVSAAAPVTGGTVVVSNTVSGDIYTLPETGGAGTYLYTTAGLLLSGVAMLLYCDLSKRRKGDVKSS